MEKDYYRILGVAKNASGEEIKRAYRRLAQQHHPDKGGSQDKFKEINEAYQVLSDSQKRQQYDHFGTTFDPSYAGYGGASGFEGFGGQGFRWNTEGVDFDFNDIFENFFGEAFSTVQTEVAITPSQAVLGDELELIVGGERLHFSIPAGIQDNTTFRFRGKGASLRRGDGRGDLLVNVRIKIPERLSREQKELYERLKEIERR